MPRTLLSLLLLLSLWLLTPGGASALAPEDLLLVVNKMSSDSLRIAEHYRNKRGIPEQNVISLRIREDEACSRSYYESEIAAPVRKFLREKDPEGKIKCLLTTSGIPLKVGPEEPAKTDLERIEIIRKRLRDLDAALKELKPDQPDAAEKTKSLGEERSSLEKELARLDRRYTSSSLDSELALVTNEHYDLDGWQPNPYFIPFLKKPEIRTRFQRVLLVSRLDGPSPAAVIAMIDKAVEAETTGLKGKVYLDARGIPHKEDSQDAGSLYDESIRKTAVLFRKETTFEVVLDNEPALFKQGACPEALFYSGWYQLANYQDSFTWAPGAVGYHIASSECQTLRRGDSRVWCKMMIEKGITATLGPVEEPYLRAMPLPHEFFGLLLTGRYSLVECYFLTCPYLSWKMVLVGDPLYNPFKSRGAGVGIQEPEVRSQQ